MCLIRVSALCWTDQDAAPSHSELIPFPSWDKGRDCCALCESDLVEDSEQTRVCHGCVCVLMPAWLIQPCQTLIEFLSLRPCLNITDVSVWTNLLRLRHSAQDTRSPPTHTHSAPTSHTPFKVQFRVRQSNEILMTHRRC